MALKPTTDYDVILVGGGLANGLIALRLRQRRPGLRMAVLEAGQSLGGNHTWSFHEPDLTPAQLAWIDPLIVHRWNGYDVRFPDLRRTFSSTYLSVTSERFHEVLQAEIGSGAILGSRAVEVSPDRVTTSDGGALSAALVIDGRGPQHSDALVLGFQNFVGQEWSLTRPHGLTRPIIMDASVPQGDGYRFVYVLPMAPDRLLIEDTHYVDGRDMCADTLRSHIRTYMLDQGWQAETLCREEQGSLPIVLAGDIGQFSGAGRPVPRVGLRAAQFHQTTGYSLPHAVSLADNIAALSELNSEHVADVIRRIMITDWRSQGFYRLLNRMLFLAGRPDQRWRVMQRFYGLGAPLIERFYARRLTVADRIRILAGKPPVPVLEAMRAARQTHPRHFEKVKAHGS